MIAIAASIEQGLSNHKPDATNQVTMINSKYKLFVRLNSTPTLPSTQRAERKRQRTQAPTVPPSHRNSPEHKSADAALSNGFKCPGGKLGLHPALPHPTSCRLYYVCLNGVTPNEAGCGKGLVFNPDTSKCDVPVNVPGCEDTYEKKKPKRQSSRGRGVTRQRKPAAAAPEQSPAGGGGDGELDLNQFAKFIEILTNPKVKCEIRNLATLSVIYRG